MSSKRDVSDELNERHRKMLARLLKEDGNKQCADCHMRNPTWASVNLGVFVCLTCSGIHRSLGVHISQVRSTNLDTWLPKQVEYISCMGNIKANRYWEAQLPGDFLRPSGVSPNKDLQAFIRNKYCEKRYAATDVPAPTSENYRSHPYVMAEEAKAATAASAPATPASGRSAMTVPLPKSQASTAATATLPPAPAAPAPAVDLLGFDDADVPPSSQSAPANSAPAANDPFALLASAAPAASSTAGNDWSDFSGASSAVTSGSAAAPSATAAPAVTTSQPTAPAKPIDPFESFAGGNLSAQLQGVSIASQPNTVAKPNSKPAVSPDDILKLYDSQSNTGFSDFFSSTPAAPPPGAHFSHAAGPLPAQHFSAPIMPSKGPPTGLQAPGHQTFPGMQPGLSPGFAGAGMIPAYGGVSHPGHAQQPQYGMPQPPGLGGFGGFASPTVPQGHGVQSHIQPSLQNQQQAGLLNNPAAFASLVSMQSPGFGGKKP